MNFLPVVLWTDILVYLLIILSSVLLIVMLKNPLQRNALLQLSQSKSGMISLLILMIFVIIGFADSLHFRLALNNNNNNNQHQQHNSENIAKKYYSVEVLSLLDYALLPLKENTEKTYSAPLATNLSALEAQEITDENGNIKVNRIYPRLQFAGQHLSENFTQQQYYDDIKNIASKSFLYSCICWLIFVALIKFSTRNTTFFLNSKHSLVIALFIILNVIFLCVNFAEHYHVFGTDKIGQDVLYQVLKSIRVALIIGLLTTLALLPLSITLGVVAGYFKGWIDDVIQYIYTVINSIPSVLLIAAAVLLMQVFIDTHSQYFNTALERADLRLLALCIILGMTSWTGLCRLLRAETLKIRELEYIQAAKAFGVSSFTIIRKHILPNLTHIIIIQLVMDFSVLVLAEAVLSYVGIGVDPTMISFGTMINNARLELSREPIVWWSLVAAFSVMLILVLSANIFADAVRKAFDPKEKINI